MRFPPQVPVRVVAVFAHPDDADFKMGGTAALMAQEDHHVKFVSIDDMIERKIDGLLAQVSRFYEGLPWVAGVLDRVPEDPAARRRWLRERRARSTRFPHTVTGPTDSAAPDPERGSASRETIL